MTAGAFLEGKTYPPVTFAVEAEKVRAFARAVGHRSNGVPPTIVTAPEIAAGLANVVADPELGVDLRRVLHGEQEYEWNRPVAVGETLTAESRIESIRGKSAMRFLTLRTEIRGEAGDLVAVGRSTLIVRGAR
jgi:acyl-coenzyme A thioesterase PaaI-like protein